MNLFCTILTHIESVFEDIVHLPLEFIFEVTKLPGFLLNTLDHLAPLQLVRCQFLLHCCAWPLQHKEPRVNFYLQVVQQIQTASKLITHCLVFLIEVI